MSKRKTGKNPGKAKPAELSNPFSTGAGGPRFENQVQTAFVVLMLTGGVVPCLPCWPIKRIKLQGRVAGYDTDDFIAFLEGQRSGEEAKLLAQIKHSLSITGKDATFGKVIQAAWADFNNVKLFNPNTDVISLITGPLSASDIGNTRTILEWARHSENAADFLNSVNRSKFSSAEKRNKLEAFTSHLTLANNGQPIREDQLWRFLKCFHLLGYDLDIKSGVALSLLNSHIGQFTNGDNSVLWALASYEVASFNQNAGTITIDTISQDLRRAFSERKRIEEIPQEFQKTTDKEMPDYSAGDLGESLMFTSLAGGFQENNQHDIDAIKELIQGQ